MGARRPEGVCLDVPAWYQERRLHTVMGRSVQDHGSMLVKKHVFPCRHSCLGSG